MLLPSSYEMNKHWPPVNIHVHVATASVAAGMGWIPRVLRSLALIFRVSVKWISNPIFGQVELFLRLEVSKFESYMKQS